MKTLSFAWLVFQKELRDALRDQRTLLMLLASSVLIGPVLLIALSSFMATTEAKAEQRQVFAIGVAHAPTLENYIARQTWLVKAAPPDYERLLHESKLGDPVLLIPSNFEDALARGEAVELALISDSANRQSEAAVPRVSNLLRGFSQERVRLNLALRGVSAQLLEPIKLENRDLAGTQTRAAQVTGMLVLLVLLAVVSGALTAALDTTAGERERGSLEPLMMNPVSGAALVLGKWGAVAAVSMLIAVLSCASFIPGQWLLRSDALQALFQFGAREVGLFQVVLLPFAAATSATLMAIAIRCRTFKEAQATSSLFVLLVSLAPLISTFTQTGEEPWHLWVPALAQNTLLMRVLRGEGFTTQHLIIPLLVCALQAVLSLWFVASRLRTAAVKS